MGFAFDELGRPLRATGDVVGNQRLRPRRAGDPATWTTAGPALPSDTGDAPRAWRSSASARSAPEMYARPETPVTCEGTEALRRFLALSARGNGAHRPVAILTAEITSPVPIRP
ncbi:hypothetical protein QJS66_13655 [Kocuria rhizophila]|nr:hypothetical protein QJS66_13655 [Kocuria rhizophila]